MGDWPGIIGAAFTALSAGIAVGAWLFPRTPAPPGSAPTQGAGAETAESGVNLEALWLYFAFLALIGIAYLLFHRTGRPELAMLWMVTAGIAYEIAFWDLMSVGGRVASIAAVVLIFLIPVTAADMAEREAREAQARQEQSNQASGDAPSPPN